MNRDQKPHAQHQDGDGGDDGHADDGDRPVGPGRRDATAVAALVSELLRPWSADDGETTPG